MLISAFLIYTPEKPKKQEPLVAQLITPEQPTPQIHQDISRKKEQKQKVFRSPRLPKNLPPPKELSAEPSKKQSTQSERSKPQKEDLSSLKDGSQHTSIEGSRNKSAGNKTPADYESFTDKSAIESGERGNHIKESPVITNREKLFDKNIIGGLAKKYADDEQKKENAITFSVKEFKYHGYIQRLKEKIESSWSYPLEAARQGIYGDLFVQFTIKKNGELGAVTLTRTSGHKVLDDAAIKALRDAAPYWELPSNWPESSITITAHFVYSLYGTFIR
ncbi:MAG: TonB family protein [Nitrospirae bacterium]|nr:TonB family protein [Nitrospirota bacterium]